MDLSAGTDFDRQPFGQGIYDRSAYAVQAARYFIASAAEFSAGMQNGEYDFHRVHARLVIDTCRNTAPVIRNRNGFIFIDGHFDVRAETGQRFIDGVIHNFIDQMVESSGRSRADIHTGTLSDCFQTFQNLNIIGCIVADLGGIFNIIIRHICLFFRTLSPGIFENSIHIF